MKKEAYSSSEIARLCHYNRETVKRWLEKGQLKGYRVGRGHWRVTPQDLAKFLEENGIPFQPALKSIHIRKGATEEGSFPEFCWEFFKRMKIPHVMEGKNCEDCLVFCAKARACYLLREETDHLRLFCDVDCKDCRYFRMIEKHGKKMNRNL
jgi:excisionase family DNA binding protein